MPIPIPISRPIEAALAAALLALAGGCGAPEAPAVLGDVEGDVGSEDPQGARPALGLMGTIPLYWGEADSLGMLLDEAGEAHWARALLERRYRLQPLDVLSAETLRPLDFLLLAQPRALAAGENVALDGWVRAGGRLLLFADPLLTGESRYPIGDRRRPQDVILLSPILTHWGLELQFDEDQRAGVTRTRLGGTAIPLNLPGQFAPLGSEAACDILAAQVLARCTIGEGQVLVLADAALLDLYAPDPAAPAALERLVAESFETAGNDGINRPAAS